MKRIATFTLGLVLILGWAPALLAQNKTGEAAALVGRITFIDGQLLRYVYAEQDWVATVKDAPFGLEDAVYSSDTGKAEFQLPNGTWARVGSDTQLQLIALRDDVTEMDVAAGTARFHAKGRNAVIKATTPFGYVLAQPDTAFDVYVGDSSAEVICLSGTVEFVLNDGEAKFAVEAGKPSIISDGGQTVEGDGAVDAAWDEWNLKRDEFWTRRIQVKGDSVKYLPPSLHDDAYDLDQHGRWERVHYQGSYQTVWRPTRVVAGWQPYSVGRWTVWYDDNTWIPGEPFGYVTHHYGNWIHVNNFWYWAPPVTVRIGYLGGCACWYPGRVAWIHSGPRVGWVPLAPTEVYYSHRYWGPASVMVARVGGISVSIGSLAFARHAVVVPQPYFYSVNNYYNVRVRNINRTTIINNYQFAPVVNNTVINNYNTTRNRYVYNTNLANVAVKPHQEVVARINQNRTFAERQGAPISARALSDSTARVRQANPIRGPEGAQQVQRPQVSSRMVPASQVNKPASEVQFNRHEMKSQARPPREVGRQVGTAGAAAVGPGRGAAQGGRGATGRPGRIAPPTAERRQQLQQERLQGRQPQPDQRRLQQEKRQQQTEMQRQQRLQRQQLDGRSRTQQRGTGDQRSLQQQRGRETGPREMREPRSLQQRPDRGTQMQRGPRDTQMREQRSMQRPDRGSQMQRQPQPQRQQMQRQPQQQRQPQMQQRQMQRQPQAQRQPQMQQRQPQMQRQQPRAQQPQGQGPQMQQQQPGRGQR